MRAESSSVTQTYHRLGSGVGAPAAEGYGSLGAKPPAAGQFFEKKRYF